MQLHKSRHNTEKRKFIRGGSHYSTEVTFLYKAGAHLYENDTYHSGKRVIFLRRHGSFIILRRKITPAHYSTGVIIMVTPACQLYIKYKNYYIKICII